MTPPARQRLPDDQVQAQMPPGWTGNAQAIARAVSFATYRLGLDFAVQVAHLAEQTGHHPDLLIGYRRVTVTYTTHDAGGVTPHDLAAAAQVNALLDGLGAAE